MRATPASRNARMATMIARVLRASITVGCRNTGTALLTASTPVNAVQPLAKARNTSQTPATVTAGGTLGGATTGVTRPCASRALTSVITIVTPRQATNAYGASIKT